MKTLLMSEVESQICLFVDCLFLNSVFLYLSKKSTLNKWYANHGTMTCTPGMYKKNYRIKKHLINPNEFHRKTMKTVHATCFESASVCWVTQVENKSFN